jgi:Protein of unknown function (DUF3800)
MVYQYFLDDSKDQNQSQMVISAGFYGTKEDWGKLRGTWITCLKRDGLEYFKTSEYKMLDGQFRKFKTSAYPPPKGRQKASEIRSALLQILKGISGIQGVGVGIPIEDYEKVCSRPEADDFFPANPYRRALEGVLFESVKAIRQTPGKHMVTFVHDNGEDYDALRGYYDQFKVANPKTAQFIAGFQALDDKKHPPLQLADMVANRSLELGLEWLANNRSPSVLREMVGNIHHFGTWTEHYMLSILKRNLKRLGRPIPLDLRSTDYG